MFSSDQPVGRPVGHFPDWRRRAQLVATGTIAVHVVLGVEAVLVRGLCLVSACWFLLTWVRLFGVPALVSLKDVLKGLEPVNQINPLSSGWSVFYHSSRKQTKPQRAAHTLLVSVILTYTPSHGCSLPSVQVSLHVFDVNAVPLAWLRVKPRCAPG